MADDTRARIIAQARARQGIPYRLDPPPDGVHTLDCSLFVLQVLASAGVPLPSGVRTAEQIRQATLPVPFADVQPGDLLFFEGTYDASGPAGADGRIASHIGISLGAGTRRMWDANEAHGVGLTDIGTDYWQSKLFEARRVPGLANEAGNNSQNILRGIDVASWQGTPDWRAVAASGISFAITKATEGVGYLNPTFARNWLEIRAAGIVRGAYHFAELGTNTPEAEADYFLANVRRVGGLAEGDLLALDLEDKDGSLKRANDVGGWALSWLRYVERQTGVAPLLYTAPSVITEHSLVSYPALAGYPLWLASYRDGVPPVPAPWTEIAIWQHSDKGSVPGIVGNVDLNRFMGTADELAALGKPAAETVASWVRPGDVGDGLLAWAAELGTEPAAPSTFLPLGRSPAVIEELVCMDGSVLRWHLPTGKRWRHRAA